MLHQLGYFHLGLRSPPAIGASDVSTIPFGNVVQGGTTPTGATSITSTTASWALPNIAGNMLLLFVGWNANTGTVSSITDPTTGDTGNWVRAGVTNRGANGSQETWYL